MHLYYYYLRNVKIEIKMLPAACTYQAIENVWFKTKIKIVNINIEERNADSSTML